MTVHVGISGWRYPPWRGVFYPAGLRQVDELAFASRAFDTIELNGSFYSLQRPQSYRAWYEATPDSFLFSVKGSRFITHMKRLKDVEVGLANFFASGLLCLSNKLGPILWQLPPSLAFEPDRLERFFALLPRDTRQLARAARKHDARLAGRAEVALAGPSRPVRHALEVRHRSFEDGRYPALLRKHGIANCVADSAGLYPLIDEATSDYVYVRLHGAEELYVSGYSSSELERWATRIRAWRMRGDVFVYFDNDVKVRAPFDAQNLRRILGGRALEALPDAQAAVTETARTTWPAWSRAKKPSSP